MPTDRSTPWMSILTLGILALASPAAAVTVNFDGFANNTLLTTQLSGQGVTFGPDGVIVRAVSGAFSAPNVTVPVPSGDISNAPWVAVFSSGQQDVSVRIRPSTSGVTSATLRAYNVSNAELLTASVPFVNQTDWRTLAASRAAGDIRKVVITAAPGNTNFVQVDNLVFTSAPPPPPPDNTPPTLTIVTPLEGAVLTQAQTNVRVTAADNRDLLTVKGDIRHVASATAVSALDFCGSGTSGGCAESVDKTVQAFFQPALEGGLRITATACDAAANCTTRTRDIVLDLPAPPAEVSVEKVEVNQGVQGRLMEIGRPGDDRVASLEALLVAGRHTLVRVYPFSAGSPRPDYRADLHVMVFFDDGSTREFRLLGPNTDPHEVDVVARPATSAAREEEYLRMRLDLGRTLNFVIPQLSMMRSLGTDTPEAVRLEMRVEAGNEPLTGWLKASLRREVRIIGHDLVLRGIAGAVTPTGAQQTSSLRFAHQVLPTTYAEGGFVVTGPSVLYVGGCPWFQNVFQCVAWALTRVQPQPSALDGFRLLYAFPPHPAESADDNPDELGAGFAGRIAMAAWGDDGVGHALGHALGFRNAGKGTNDRVTLGFGPHGEESPEDWPYGHGGALGNHVFGIFISTSVPDRDNPVTGGEFAVTLIDPCPGGTLAERGSGCQKEPETHDFMSWANSAGGVPAGLRPRHHNWISVHNWNRAYEKLRQGIVLAPSSATRAAASAPWPEALLVDGILEEGGGMELLPIVRQAVAPEALLPPPAGPYSLELLAAGGAVLHSRSFDVIDLVEGAPEKRLLMMQVVPAVESLARVRVRKGAELILDQTASAHAPAVELVAPAGGETWQIGKHTVDWTASDADGGPLYTQLEYSANRGATWQMLALLGPGEPSHFEIDAGELEASAQAVFRVTVSDGIRSSSDRSLCPVAVGAPAPAACTGSCVPGPNRLCLGGTRFQVEADWETGAGQSGAAVPVKLTEDTGYLWFFDDENVEAVVKVLDGCGLNGRFWVFAGGLTNVETTLRVTDTISGETRTYVNPQDQAFQPIQDTGAFATCAVGARGGEALAPRPLPGAGSLTLNQNRFTVTAHWRTAAGEGDAEAVELTDDTGYFWFFDPANVEAVVKVLDGCGGNGHYWVFAGGLTDVEVAITVTDTETGQHKTYTNPPGTAFQPIQDTVAFGSCP